MNMWMEKYTDETQTKRFACEQDYVDFTFIMIVLYNFQTLLMPEDLMDSDKHLC